MLDNTSYQPSKFRTKNWVEINDVNRGTCNTNSQIRFKTTMLKSSFCDYSDAYILGKGNITVPNTAVTDAHASDVDVVMPMYNLIEYSENYLKTSESL